MEQKVRLTVLDGMNEIGGNIVFLEDFKFNVNLFIDFGVNIKNYHDNYERGESISSIQELVKLGILPKEENLSVNNLYTNDFSGIVLKRRKKNNEKKEQSSSSDNLFPSNLDAILVSHLYKDHFFGLSFINRSVFLK